MHTCLFADGSSLVRPSELGWAPWLSKDGRIQLLDVDHDFNKVTLLLRHENGGPWADAIQHHGVAELFVESGEIRFDGGRAAAEDYVYIPGGRTLKNVVFAKQTQVYAILHGGITATMEGRRTSLNASDWVNMAGADAAPAHLAELGRH